MPRCFPRPAHCAVPGLPARLMKMAPTVLMVRTFQRKMRDVLKKIDIWVGEWKTGKSIKINQGKARCDHRYFLDYFPLDPGIVVILVFQLVRFRYFSIRFDQIISFLVFFFRMANGKSENDMACLTSYLKRYREPQILPASRVTSRKSRHCSLFRIFWECCSLFRIFWECCSLYRIFCECCSLFWIFLEY